MKKRITRLFGEQVMVEGMMTLGMLETGLRTMDFECCEDVEAAPFRGDFSVQGMRDGNIYMTEKMRRKRNKPLFREDNSSLSLGRDGRYYFIFSLPQEQADVLPKELMRQAFALARKLEESLNDE